MAFDPRLMGKPVYITLTSLKAQAKDEAEQKDQKNQAVELYTYLSTWGLLRLKAEENALSQPGRKEVVKKFFACLSEMIDHQPNLKEVGDPKSLLQLSADDYLGLTGVALKLAQEFSFWANSIYWDVKGSN